MAGDYIPSQNGTLIPWAANIAEKVQAAPISVGLVAAQATQLTNASNLLASTFTTAFQPDTRTKGSIQTFVAAKKAFLATVRPLVRIIQGFPGLTNEQRADLRITIHAPLSPVNPPAVGPAVEIVSTQGRTITVKVHSTSSDKRKKPAGCIGANIYAFVGATPPAAQKDWIFQGLASRALVPIVFDASVPAGSQVWLAATWVTARGLTSPASTPLSAYLAGGMTKVG